MAQVWAFVWILVGLLVAWPCLVIWFALMFPNPVRRSRERLEAAPGLCMFTGAALALLLGGLAVVLINLPNGLVKLAGYAILAVLLIGATLGAAGMVRLLGERLEPLCGSVSPLGVLIRGAALTELASLFPVIGWFLFLPVATLANLGAGVLGLARRREAPHSMAMPAYAAEFVVPDPAPPAPATR